MLGSYDIFETCYNKSKLDLKLNLDLYLKVEMIPQFWIDAGKFNHVSGIFKANISSFIWFLKVQMICFSHKNLHLAFSYKIITHKHFNLESRAFSNTHYNLVGFIFIFF